MKQSAKLRGVPPLILTVGNQFSHPASKEYKRVLQRATKLGAKLRNWDCLAIPWNWDFGFAQGGTPFDFTPHLEFINRRIVFSLLGSISLIESIGPERARTIESVWLRVIESFRRKVAKVLEEVYHELLSLNGIEERIKIEWAPLKEPMSKAEISATLTTLHQLQALRDVNELREQFTKLGILELEPIPEEELEMGNEEPYYGEEIVTHVVPTIAKEPAISEQERINLEQYITGIKNRTIEGTRPAEASQLNKLPVRIGNQDRQEPINLHQLRLGLKARINDVGDAKGMIRKTPVKTQRSVGSPVGEKPAVPALTRKPPPIPKMPTPKPVAAKPAAKPTKKKKEAKPKKKKEEGK